MVTVCIPCNSSSTFTPVTIDTNSTGVMSAGSSKSHLTRGLPNVQLIPSYCAYPLSGTEHPQSRSVSFRLCAQPQSKFDATINRTHSLQCLQQLLTLYDATHQDCYSVPTTGVRAEMEALYLLLGLGNSDALRRALQLPQELRWCQDRYSIHSVFHVTDVVMYTVCVQI
jgi:hypothetical protein